MIIKKYYGYGNGSFGCLYDHADGPYDSPSEAALAARDALKLTQKEARRLFTYRYLAIEAGRREEVDADYVEIFECEEDWSWY